MGDTDAEDRVKARGVPDPVPLEGRVFRPMKGRGHPREPVRMVTDDAGRWSEVWYIVGGKRRRCARAEWYAWADRVGAVAAQKEPVWLMPLASMLVRNPARAIFETEADEKLRAALWCLAHAAGGTVEVLVSDMLPAMLQPGAMLHLELEAHPVRMIVRATKGTSDVG